MKTRKLNCIVVDNSEMQREQLKKLISLHPLLNLAASYKNGLEALDNINDIDQIDLLFLDIDIPHIDGFELLETLVQSPQVIIISNNADHALKAFDYDVADYLLKPTVPYRFESAVDKAFFKSGIGVPKQKEKHIFVKCESRSVRVRLSDIKWVEALGDYVKLVMENKNMMILSSMTAFAKQLPNKTFVRIHKSYIINLQKVENFNSSTVAICGRKIPLSRKRKMEFREAVGFYE
ncbi:LytTR family DNA-binding domain-containing protein [uncultured Kriegella sp.]|uniref:LytR/AlgR family response regulator transcription factor n=1 Tax=uncultured Kriegella sp. TaxID=1798910 RepID=UPI0030DB2E69|tara:strand:- start:68020 stop:68724 length:705 start_codon:yes stop_codon:yes gene_type:complete